MRYILSLLLVSGALCAGAQQVENPIRYTWIATSCKTWDCTVAALVLGNGGPGLIALPTVSADWPWVLLRRVEEGSIWVPEDEPFMCDVLDSVNEARIRFESLDSCRMPVIVSVPDGRTLVVSRRKCDVGRRRAVR